MIEAQHDVTAEPAPTPASKRRKRAMVIGISAVVILGAGIGIGTALNGSNPAPTAKPKAAATLYLTGSLQIPFVGSTGSPQALDTTSSTELNTGDACTATGGFDDIAQGAAVTLGGPTGQTLAVGQLAAGTVTQPLTSTTPVCEFDFDGTVAAGLSEYTVTIGHRGTQVFTPTQVAQNDVLLTLGD